MSEIKYVLSVEVDGTEVERKTFDLKPDTQAGDRHRVSLQAGLLLKNVQEKYFKEEK